jgi:hypothetical protein
LPSTAPPCTSPTTAASCPSIPSISSPLIGVAGKSEICHQSDSNL